MEPTQTQWDGSISYMRSSSSSKKLKIGDRNGSMNGRVDLIFIDIIRYQGIASNLEGGIKIGTFIPINWQYSASVGKDTNDVNDIFTEEEIENSADSPPKDKLQEKYTIPYSIGLMTRFKISALDFYNSSWFSGIGLSSSSFSFQNNGNWFQVKSYETELPLSMLYNSDKLIKDSQIFASLKLNQRLFSVSPRGSDLGIQANIIPITFTVGLNTNNPFDFNINYSFTYFTFGWNFENTNLKFTTNQHILGIALYL